jgi:hypothetical protein
MIYAMAKMKVVQVPKAGANFEIVERDILNESPVVEVYLVKSPGRPVGSASPARRPWPSPWAMPSSRPRGSDAASCPWIRRNSARREGCP